MSKETIAHSAKDLVNQYQYHNSGHFFDRDTMRFFNSRVTSNYHRLSDTQAAFITTEKGPNGVRAATIRIATLVRSSNGRIKIKIETYSKFNELSLEQAKSILRNAKMND